MKVSNKCSFTVVAAIKHGLLQGDTFHIEPGQTSEVWGPRIHEFMDERRSQPGAGCITMIGKVTVHEDEDSDVAMQVLQSQPLNYGAPGGTLMLIVSHVSDVVDDED